MLMIFTCKEWVTNMNRLQYLSPTSMYINFPDEPWESHFLIRRRQGKTLNCQGAKVLMIYYFCKLDILTKLYEKKGLDLYLSCMWSRDFIGKIRSWELVKNTLARKAVNHPNLDFMILWPSSHQLGQAVPQTDYNGRSTIATVKLKIDFDLNKTPASLNSIKSRIWFKFFKYVWIETSAGNSILKRLSLWSNYW